MLFLLYKLLNGLTWDKYVDANSRLYFDSALKLKLPVSECRDIFGFQLALGKYNYYFFDKNVPNNNASSSLLVGDKYCANAILSKHNIPVPKATQLLGEDFSHENLTAVISDFKFPLVLKPTLYTSMGKDVICNITDYSTLYTLCEKLFKGYACLSIEEYHGNLQDYRILIFKNKIIDVVERYPPRVIGDGMLTIEQLVEKANEMRKQTSNIYLPIKFDHEAQVSLLSQGLTKESIPNPRQTVVLGYTCNTSRGGTIRAGSMKMCKENKALFLKTVKVLNLEFAGLDICCKSLLEPLQGNGVIIEVNASPSVRIHEDGLGGAKKKVTYTVMKSYIYKHPILYLLHRCKNYYLSIILTIVVLLPFMLWLITHIKF